MIAVIRVFSIMTFLVPKVFSISAIKHHHEKKKKEQPEELLIEYYFEPNELPTHHYTSTRHLSSDEFEGLNDFLSTVSFETIGDTFYIKDYTPPISPLLITVSDMECQDISLQDISYKFEMSPSNRKVDHLIAIENFASSCELGYAVESLDMVPVARGRVSMSLIDTSMKVSVETTSSMSFEISPPISAEGGICELNLGAVDNVQLDGFVGIMNPIINLVTNNLPQMLKERFEADFCCEFNAFMKYNVTKVLKDVELMLSPYINNELSNEDVNELESQENLITTGHNFLDFTNSDSCALNILIQNITNDLNENLGGDNLGVDDGINKYLKSAFLDENGDFSITQRDIQSYNNGVVFSTQDQILNMELYLDSIVIGGLNTFMNVHLMQGIAPQTLQTSIKLRNLSLEGAASLKLYSTDDENDDLSVYLRFSDDNQTIENIQFETSLDDINLDLTTLVAIDMDQISEDLLRVNQFLNVSCFSSFLSTFEIARLDLSMDMSQSPNLSNLFQSDELDRVVNSIISSQLKTYESVFFNRAMTNMISTKVREDVNEKIGEVLAITSNKDCPPIKTTGENEFMDFRDLLLNRSMATEYGASGEEPYGNIVPIAIRFFEDAFLKPTMMGGKVPWMNVVLIAPITKLLSGKSGHINMIELITSTNITTSCVFNSSNLGENTFDYGFGIQKAEIYNLDSFGYPLRFLAPQKNEPHKLSNDVHLGAVDGLPLKFVSQVELFIDVGTTTADVYDDEQHSSVLLDTLKTFSRVNFEINLEITKLFITSEIMAKVKESEFLNFNLKDARGNPYCIMNTLIPVIEEEEEKALSIFIKELSFEQIDLDLNCFNCTSSTLTSELPKIMNILRDEGSIQTLVEKNVDLIVEFVNGLNVQNEIDKLIAESREKCFEENQVTPPSLLMNPSILCEDIIMSVSLPIIENIYSLESILYTSVILFQIGLVVFPLSIVESQQDQNIMTVQTNDIMRLEEEFRSNGELGGVLDLSSDKSISLLGHSLNHLLRTVNFMVGSGFMNVYNVEDILGEILSTTSQQNQLSQYNNTSNVTVKYEDIFINSIISGLLSTTKGDGEEIFVDLSEYDELMFDLNDLMSLGSSPSSSSNNNQSNNIILQLQSMTISGINSFRVFEPYILVGGQTFMSKFALDNFALDLKLDLYTTSNSNDEIQKESIWLGMELENIVLDIGIFLALREEILSKIPLKPLLSTDTLLDCLIPALQHIEIIHLDSSAVLKDMTLGGGLIKSDDIRESVRKTFRSIMSAYQSQLKDAFHIITQKLLREEINKYIQNTFLSSLQESTDFGNCYFDIETDASENVFIDWHLLFKEIPTPKQEVFPYGDIIPKTLSFFREYLLKPSKSGENEGLPEINNYIPDEFVIPGDVFYYKQDLNFSVMSDLPYFFYGNLTNVRLSNINSFDMPISLLLPDLNNQYLIQNEFTLGVASKPLKVGFQLDVGVINGNNDQKDDENSKYDIHDIVDILIEIEGLKVGADIHVQMNENDLMSMQFVKSLFPMCLLSTIPIPEESNDDDNDDLLTLSASLDLQYSSVNILATCVSCSSPHLEHMDEMLDHKEIQSMINERGGEFLEALNPSLDEVADVLLNLLLSTAKPLCAITTQNMDELDFSQLDFDAIDMNQIDVEDLDSFDLNNIDPSAVDQQKLLSSFMESSPIKLPSVAFVNDSIYFVVGLSSFAIIILLVTIYFMKRQKKRARKHQLDALSALSEEELFHVFLDQIIEDAKVQKLNECNVSMLLNEDIPTSIRYGVLLLLAINTVTFVLAHVLIDSRVDIIGVFAGQEILLKNMFEFAIGTTIFEAYENGAKFGAVCIMFSSLLWPYIKIIATLVCFSLPPTKVSIQTRGKIFHTLGKLNKWSMMDVFILIIRILIFDVNFVSPDINVDGEIISLSEFGDDITEEEEKLYDIRMSYNLQAGIYMNLLSQLIMQLSSEIISSRHEKILRDEMSKINQGISDLQQQEDNNMSKQHNSSETESYSEEIESRASEDIMSNHTEESCENDDECSTDSSATEQEESGNLTIESSSLFVEPPSQHFFTLKKQEKDEKQNTRMKKSAYIFVLFCCALATVTLFLGFILPCFTLEIFGVAGYILIAGMEDSDTTLVHHNMFQILRGIMNLETDDTPVIEKIGLVLIVSIVIIPCLIAPLVQIGTLVALWSTKLRRKHRTFLYNSLEFLSSWQYIDVFVGSVLLFMWQGDEFVEYGIDVYCEKLRNIVFPITVYADILDPQNARCYVLNFRLQPGCYFLIATSLILPFITNMLTKALKQQDMDLEEQERRNKEGENDEDRELNHIIVSMGAIDESAIDDILHNLEKKPLSFTETFPFFFSSSNLHLTTVDDIDRSSSNVPDSIKVQLT